MLLNSLNINNLRNHIESDITLEPKINIFYGKNGSGKTTILEAISILSISKSFLPTIDSSLISSGKNYYNLTTKASNDLGVPYRINIKYNGSGRKVINSSYGDNLLPKNIIGEIPIVILSPDHKTITFGGPQDRRQFIDSVLSQSSKIFIEEALKSKKYLKQRNAILTSNLKERKIDKKLFEAITELFILSSAEVVHRRSKFIHDFKLFFLDTYKRISDENEEVDLVYIANTLNENIFSHVLEKNDIIESYQKKYERICDKEFQRGITLFGPQKDDLEITIGNKTARDAASQGQHKSLLLSLKLAEFDYLRNIKNETPIFMLDDIFSELDSERSHNINKIVNDIDCQTFITITNRDKFNAFRHVSSNVSYYKIVKGIVRKE